MNNMTAYDYIKYEAILHKILLENDLEKEINKIGIQNVFNEKLCFYLNIILDNVDKCNKYELYKTKEVIKQLRELINLIPKSIIKIEEKNHMISKINILNTIPFSEIIPIQTSSRTYSKGRFLFDMTYESYLNDNYLKDLLKKDYNLIEYFEGKETELDSDNISSLIYFYNFMKYVYSDINIYSKTLELINININAFKSQKYLKGKYKDNKILLKKLGGKYVG